MMKKLPPLFVLILIAGSTLQAQPLVHYTFNDGTARDVSGNGFDGTLLGSAAIATDAERGQVLQVNTSGMMVDGPFPIGTSFTVSAWTRLDVPRTGRYYFGGPWWIRTDNQGGSEHHWCEMRYPEGAFVDKFDTRSASSPEGQLDGQWHHIVVVLPDNGEVKAYVDGVQAPVRDNGSKVHDFGGSVGPLFFGTQNESGGNAISGFMDNIQVFNYAVAEEDIMGLMEEGRGPEFADEPMPDTGTVDVLRDVTLGWAAGSKAVTHNVYLGTSLADVNDAGPGSALQIGDGLADTRLDAGRLEFGQTYYWRVDEVNGAPDFTTFAGDIWEFTTELLAYPVTPVAATASSVNNDQMGPQNTINGSGLDDLDQHSTNAVDMWLTGQGDASPWIQYEFGTVQKLHELWVWNSNQGIESFIGFGAKTASIEVSMDGTNWTAVNGVPEFAQAPGRPDYTHSTVVDLGGIGARFVRINIEAGWGGFGQLGLSEVRFFAIPVQASRPQPAHGASGVELGAVLSWRGGREAAEHEVRLGTDRSDLPALGTVAASEFDTSGQDIVLGQTYYWQVNEVNAAEVQNVWPGAVWSFTASDYAVVDGFESYNDICERIFFSWEDGFGHNGSEECGVDPFDGNGSGSLVGNATAPFAERSIVHAGRQSMPFEYENTSEAVRTWSTGQDWTQGGAQTLVLYFHGTEENTGQLYIKINGVKVTYDGPAEAVSTAAWTQWNIDLGTLGVDLQNVNELTIGAESGAGILYIDDIRLYIEAPAGP